MSETIVARFHLHVRCENCDRRSSRVLDVPNVEGAPVTTQELVDSGMLSHLSYKCEECESAIGQVAAVTVIHAANIEEIRSRPMAASNRVTLFVVMGFKRDKQGRLEADQPVRAPTADAARRKAQRYEEAGGAAIAFSRTGDPALGDWDEAVTLSRCGLVPEEALDGYAAA